MGKFETNLDFQKGMSALTTVSFLWQLGVGAGAKIGLEQTGRDFLFVWVDFGGQKVLLYPPLPVFMTWGMSQ